MSASIQGNILVVDDTPENLNVLLEHFSKSHLKVFVAESGERALVQVEYVKPDLILMDVMMPGIDGFETLRRLKASPETRHIPVIFMTALADTIDKVKGFELGAVDYITKPFQQEELLARVMTHLNLHRLQRTLEETNRVLLKENENKNLLFSLIAHEIRAPLNSISFAVDAMVRYGESASKEQLLQQIHSIHKATLQLGEMTESLIHWAQIQMQGRVQHPQVIDLHELIQLNLELFDMMIGDKALHVANEIPPQTTIFADRDMVDSVIRNLVSNAIKFTPSSGSITIASEEKNDFTDVTIQDTGIGMDKHQLDKIFKIETRFSTPGTHNEKGSGLGLILCRDMMEANNGKIWAHSEPGKGSRFTCRFPRAKLKSKNKK
jgi:two-component system, sensor histidine kinase and response regulator